MLSVVCWKWRPVEGAPETYTAGHVNELQRQVARHYDRPHRFICVTDDVAGIAPEVEIVPLWDTLAEIPNPSNPKGPRCHRRLYAFSDEARDLFGERFVSVDLDCVITGDLAPLWDRGEDFVIWSNPAAAAPYNASMFLMTAGSRRHVWTDFDPARSPKIGRSRGFYGSDQAWIAVCLGPLEATWSDADGVLSFRRHVRKTRTLPAGTRIVFFAGRDKPWHAEIRRRHRWINEVETTET